MKLKLFCRTLSLIFVVAFLSGCKEDVEKAVPIFELKAADNTYSLKDARIFLRFEGETEGAQIFLRRAYVITDGELVSGNGFSKDDFENATYFLTLQLGIPEGNEWDKGEFLQYSSWSGIPNGLNVSYISSNFDWEIDRYYTTHSTEHAPVNVSGGVEPGDKISIKYVGNVQYHRLSEDHETWLVTNEPCMLIFSGNVIDRRE